MSAKQLEFPLFIGTMGFAYKDWNSVFYPADLASRSYLNYYSRIFNSVEIDSSFYGTPARRTIQKWLADTPPEFKFTLKAPQKITHELALVNSWGYMAEFIDTVRALGNRLGVILLQFPPSFTISQLKGLEQFIVLLPGDLKFAIEIRHQSWYTAERDFAALLQEYQIAWAATHYPGLPGTLHHTADFFYIRWIGKHGSYRQHDFERMDRTADLSQWWQNIQSSSEGINNLFGYFNNDYAGFAVGTAMKFLELIGQPVKAPDQPKQTRLF